MVLPRSEAAAAPKDHHIEGMTHSAALASMPQKFRELGAEVHVDADKVKQSNKVL
jgi:hypothetical protein